MAKQETERGFALLAVTVTLAVLALMIGAVAFSARDYVRESASGMDSVKLAAALDAGVATAGRDLSGPNAASLHYLRTPETFTLGEVTVTISARPEASKVDLNAADPTLISALLRADGLSRDRAERLADEIADWRDADSEARPHGAETADYLAAGRTELPANAPFTAVSELSGLLDGNRDLPRCLGPDVTIFSRQSRVDLAMASTNVRRAMAILDPKSAAPSPLMDGALLDMAPDIYEVDIEAHSATAAASRQVVLRITGSPKSPIWIMARSDPKPNPEEAQRVCARLAAAAP